MEQKKKQRRVRTGRPPRSEAQPVVKNQKQLGSMLQDLRIQYGYTQNEMADRLGVKRSNYSGYEVGRINFLYYFGKLCRIFSKEEMINICGVDWDLYTAERLNVYAIHFGVDRKDIAEAFGIAYSALRYMMRDEFATERYLIKYKDAMDKLFPRLNEPDLKHYYLCGYNSMAYCKKNCIFIFPNVNNNRNVKDDEKDLDFLMESALRSKPQGL